MSRASRLVGRTFSLILLAMLAVGAYMTYPRFDLANTAPAAYLVAPSDTTETPRVLIGFWPVSVHGALPVAAGTQIRLLWDTELWVLTADGNYRHVKGATTLKIESADAPKHGWGVPLSQWMTEAPAPKRTSSLKLASPHGATRHQQPTLDWVAAPDVKYDVAILDPEDTQAPPRLAKEVRPPVDFSKLEPNSLPPLRQDRIYHALLRVSGNESTAIGLNFYVTPDADTSGLVADNASRLLAAAVALNASPYRTGDAWLDLHDLPAPWGTCELAQRLRLRLYSELGHADDYSATQTALQNRE